MVCYRFGDVINAFAFTLSGTTFTFGSPVTVIQVSGSTLNPPNLCALSSTAAAIVSNVSGGTTAMRGVVVTVSGTTITSGVLNNNLNINKNSSEVCSIASLSSSLFVLFCNSSANTVSVSGSGSSATLTGNTAITVATTSDQYSLSLCALSSTSLIAGYQFTDGSFRANVLTVSGTTLTSNAQATINAATTTVWNSITALSSTTALVLYYESASLQAANVLTVSGTTISVGTKSTVNSNNSSFFRHSITGLQAPSVANPSATNAIGLICFNLSGSGSEITQSFSVSGTNVTPNTSKLILRQSPAVGARSGQRCAGISRDRYVLLTNETADNGRASVVFANLIENGTVVSTSELGTSTTNRNYMAVVALSPSVLVATYPNSSNFLVGNVITVSGNSLIIGAQATINANSTSFNSLSPITSTSLVAHCQDTSSNQATANILTVSGSGAGATISVASPVQTAAGTYQFHQVVALSPTRIVFIADDGAILVSWLYSLSGTTLTFLSSKNTIAGITQSLTFSPAWATYTAASPLSSSKYIVFCYALRVAMNGTTTNYIQTLVGVVVDITNDFISIGQEKNIYYLSRYGNGPAGSDSISLAMCSSNFGVCAILGTATDARIPNCGFITFSVENFTVNYGEFFSVINNTYGSAIFAPYVASLQTPSFASPNTNKIVIGYNATYTGYSQNQENKIVLTQIQGLQ